MGNVAPRAVWAGIFALIVSLFLAPAMADDRTPDATIEIDQAQFALLATVKAGGGKLMYKGETYEFQIGGLGLGGVGIADLKATGKVFGLTKLEDFYGTYFESAMGAAAATEGVAEMWMKNGSGVELVIEADAAGALLTMDANGMVISER